MEGTVHTKFAYKDTVNKLQTRFPDFHVQDYIRLLRFKGNPELLKWLMDNADFDEDGAISMTDLSNIQNMELYDDVVSLKESDEFPNILNLTPNLRLLKITKWITENIDVSNKQYIENVNLEDSYSNIKF